MLNVVAIMFPSPYGDGTRLSIHQKLNLRYRPLAGIRCNKTFQSLWITVIRYRPLAGIVQAWLGDSSTLNSFRPLAGMVQDKPGFIYADTSFRPLTGMVRLRRNIQSWTMRFRSPCGDKLK